MDLYLQHNDNYNRSMKSFPLPDKYLMYFFQYDIIYLEKYPITFLFLFHFRYWMFYCCYLTLELLIFRLFKWIKLLLWCNITKYNLETRHFIIILLLIYFKFYIFIIFIININIAFFKNNIFFANMIIIYILWICIIIFSLILSTVTAIQLLSFSLWSPYNMQFQFEY